MKHNFLKLLFFSTLAVLAIACSDDEPTAADPLAGTWVLKSNLLDCADDSMDRENTFTCDTQNCTRVTYSGGTTTVSSIYNGSEGGDTYSYTINGNTVNNADGEIVAFKIVGDELILTLVNGDCTTTITYYKEV
jgi:hypothetical protein